MNLRTRTELFLLTHVAPQNRDAAREELHEMLNAAEMAGRRAETRTTTKRENDHAADR